jgi:UPF0176 protein
MIQVAALYHLPRSKTPPPCARLCWRCGEEQAIKRRCCWPRRDQRHDCWHRGGLAAVIAHIRALPGCADIEVKYATAPAMPFGRMKVKLKREIVTMGVEGIDPKAIVGTYVEPQDWNALIRDPDTILIDTRNDYEVAIGTFEGAIDPQTQSFRQFPDWFRSQRAQLLGEGKRPKVAMFCTGGIRCEKIHRFPQG